MKNLTIEQIVKKPKSKSIDWTEVSSRPNLPEEFIRKFANKVNWFNVSNNPNLSEGFIREFQDKVRIRLG